MVKTLRNTRGQYAGSIGDGKTQTPTLQIIPPVTTLPKVVAAANKLEQARLAYETAQQKLFTTKQKETQKANAYETKVNGSDDQTNIKGTLKDGTTQVDITLFHFPQKEYEKPTSETTEAYRIQGKINNREHDITLARNTENPKTWHGHYRQANPKNMPRVPKPLIRRGITNYTISFFSITPQPEENYIYALPLNKKGEPAGPAIPYNEIPQIYQPALDTEMKQIINIADEIKTVYEKSLKN